MPEIKNTFLASKMNKDLDDRLIPNGEYRDAQNISVGKSEDDDIGSLESILGNACVTNFTDSYRTSYVTQNQNLIPETGDYKIILDGVGPVIRVGDDIYLWDNSGEKGTKYLSKVAWFETTSGITTVYVSEPLPYGLPVNQRIIFARPIRVCGYYSDEARSRMYVFLTDYTGTEPLQPSGHINCIYTYTPGADTFNALVFDGGPNLFLNFSTASPITGISLIEDLLFFTDNRNQPRKINVTRSSGYYTSEASISVAKYNPYEPIEMVKTASGNIASSPSTSTITLAVITSGTAASVSGSEITITGLNYNIKPGQVVGSATVITTYIKVLGIEYVGGNTIVTLSAAPGAVATNTINFYPGFEIFSSIVSTTIGYDQYLYVSAWAPSTGIISVNLPITGTISANEPINFLISTMTNKKSVTNWPGDPDYLETLFVRFSYRFRYDDGEYSIIAPFTQIAYIPKQQGYFIGSGGTPATPKDEEAAYRSTILEWMENNVQDIELIIPLPDIAKNLGESNSSTYKISSIDILYKESDSNAVKVLDNVESSSFNSNSLTQYLDYYTYNYQSRKPYKTLPTVQTTRVYDMVPTRALAQETAGNRIIYGNFVNQHTPPNTLNYQVGIAAKQTDVNEGYTNWVEYPNHSLKQNRNYQVGFILSDKWGRQSSVILSSINPTETTSGSITYGGSTVYSPYNETTLSRGQIATWPGDALQLNISSIISSGTSSSQVIATVDGAVSTGGTQIKVDHIGSYDLSQGLVTFPSFEVGMLILGVGIASGTRIKSKISPSTFEINKPLIATLPDGNSITLGGVSNFPSISTGEPGLYAIPSGTGTGFNIFGATATIQGNVYVFTLNSGGGQNIPLAGDIMRGENEDYVKITSISNVGAVYTVTTSGPVNSKYYLNSATASPDNKYSYNLNPTGWYSYKIVVRQQEQEYYNVYLPGIINGYPDQIAATSPVSFVEFPTDEDNKTANIVLFNDNINKIPRDLSEVGPEQKQFRSSIQLSGRVTNTVVGSSSGASENNKQYFPGVLTDTAISISTATDSNMAFEVLDNSGAPVLYSTLSSFGQDSLYQLDTNPLIARLSTNEANPIGVTSTNVANTTMKPYLAVYETEPTDSLLDIYWETTTVGMISDLNADILNTFDGAVGFGPIGWVLDESKGNNDTITNVFKARNSGGVDLQATMSMSVVDGSGQAFGGFVLVGNSTSGYSIKTSQFFTYINGSDTLQVFTFTFTGSVDIGSGAGSGEPFTLSFTESLANKPPVFDATLTGSNLPTIQALPSSIVLGSGSLPAKNGANVGGAETDELRWRITGLTFNGSTAVNNIFSIGEQNGNLTKTSGTAQGTYVLQITLEDCWNGSTQGVGFMSIVVNQPIVVQSAFTGMPSSNGQVFSGINCSVSQPNTYYHDGNPGTDIQDGDILYQDANGTTPVPDFYYLVTNPSGSKVIINTTGSNGNGVVIIMSTCP